MSDTESYIYRYSWDKEDLLHYPWKERYVKQPEVLTYLNHVVDKYDLRRRMRFHTEFTAMSFDETTNRWTVTCKNGAFYTAKYVVTAVGLLSQQNYPDIAGLSSFQGELYHSARFPQDVNFKDKRIGVIGCGSTGVQIITAIAKQNSMQKLLCFQRTPQWSVPSGDRPVSQEYRDDINKRYDEIWENVFNSTFAFGVQESTMKTTEVSPEKRERIYEEAWQRGNGFGFMYSTFSDITWDEKANETTCAFLSKKIKEIVKDPEKARKLIPREMYARRPLCDSGYYEQYNRPNVDIVDIKTTPIIEITPAGIKTSDGTLYELDMLIFATGFDAVEGSYNRCEIIGRNGQTLRNHWSQRVTSLYGLAVPSFPNLFMIVGPNSPATNNPPIIETQVDFIAKAISKAGNDKAANIEATDEAEEWWTGVCDEACEGSLFKKTKSWFFGSNIPGKPFCTRFYFPGMKEYRKNLEVCVDFGYKGFHPF
jgi:cyclohexanone monooxygenase